CPGARARRTSSITSYLLTSGLLLALGGGCGDEAPSPAGRSSGQDRDDRLDEDEAVEGETDEGAESDSDSDDDDDEARTDSAATDDGDDKGTRTDSEGPSATADAGTNPSDK